MEDEKKEKIKDCWIFFFDQIKCNTFTTCHSNFFLSSNCDEDEGKYIKSIFLLNSEPWTNTLNVYKSRSSNNLNQSIQN